MREKEGSRGFPATTIINVTANISYSALVKSENVIGYPKNFQESFAFHREAAIFLQNCGIKLILCNYGEIP